MTTTKTFSIDELSQFQGRPVYDSSGEKIGSVDQIFYDRATGEPEWVGIGTGFLGLKTTLVPLQGTRSATAYVSPSPSRRSKMPRASLPPTTK